AHTRAFCRQLMFAQVLRGVEGGARTERSQEELGRGHAFVVASVLAGLIGDEAVSTGFDLELRPSQVLNQNLHGFLLRWPMKLRRAVPSWKKKLAVKRRRPRFERFTGVAIPKAGISGSDRRVAGVFRDLCSGPHLKWYLGVTDFSHGHS